MADTGKEGPKAGDQMVEEITDPDGNVLYRAIYEIEADPKATKATRGAQRELPLRAVRKQEVWLDEEFEKLQQEGGGEERATRGGVAGAAEAVTKAAEVGLAIAKFGWEFIKDNKPVVDLEVASSSVLSAEDKNSLHYYGAKQGSSGQYRIHLYNWPFQKWTAVDIRVELAGTYSAKPPRGVSGGYYLPTLYFNVPVCDAYWPYSVSASAQVMSPANIGSAESVNPMCEVVAKINIRSFIENVNRTFKFKAVGNAGFSRQ